MTGRHELGSAHFSDSSTFDRLRVRPREVIGDKVSLTTLSGFAHVRVV